MITGPRALFEAADLYTTQRGEAFDVAKMVTIKAAGPTDPNAKHSAPNPSFSPA